MYRKIVADVVSQQAASEHLTHDIRATLPVVP